MVVLLIEGDLQGYMDLWQVFVKPSSEQFEVWAATIIGRKIIPELKMF